MSKKITAVIVILCAWISPVFSDQPNVVFILADDMGYADLGCYQSPDAKTPNIDRLAKEGVRFTNVYAMGPECTPSRTSILTGRYPQRVGGLECAIGTGNVGRYDDAIRLAEKKDLGLPADLAVLAPSLQKQGYYNGVFGKWHLGYEEKFSPLRQGFDEFIGFLGGNVEYFRHVELSDLEVYLSGTEPIKREGYLTDLIHRDAMRFLNERVKEKDASKPFFLYLPHAAPHFPFQGPDEDTGRLPTTEEWTQGTRESYLKMITSLDNSVGELLDFLEENELADNTIVIFASDHGAMKPGLNTPWRDYKGTLFDGGIRVPLVVRWPDKVKPQSESSQLGSLMDLSVSILNAAGVQNTADLDGIDLIAHHVEEQQERKRSLFWRSKRGERTWWAVRNGQSKYIRKEEEKDTQEWLFDLALDPRESRNLATERKPMLEQLRTELLAWEAEVAHSRGLKESN